MTLELKYRDKMMEGLEKGLEKRLKKGLKKGLKRGLSQGRAEGEHTKAIETARNFLAMGLSAEKVAQGTGLSLAEIQSLR